MRPPGWTAETVATMAAETKARAIAIAHAETSRSETLDGMSSSNRSA